MYDVTPVFILGSSFSPLHRVLRSKRHRYAIALPDELGTSPMVHDGSDGTHSGKRGGGGESRK